MRGLRTAYTRSMSEMEREKYQAQDSEIAEMADRAWTETVVAERHSLLVGRFMWMADAERQLASRMAATPGRAMLAETTRVRATRYSDTAERHRRAAQQHGEEGARLANEVHSMVNGARGRQRPQANPANPGNPAQPARQRPQQTQQQMAREPNGGSSSQ